MLRTALALALAVTAPAVADTPAADRNPKEAPQLRLPGPAGVGAFVPDVAFTDLAGKAGRLSDFKGSKFTVVAFTSTTCPVCKKYAPSLRRFEKDWAAKGVSFLFVNPTKTDKPADHGFAGRYVHDAEGVLTAAFGATSTAEVFVLDAARTVQYRGALDDQYGLGYALDAPRNNYLAVALADLLAGKRPAVLATTAPGCELTPDAAKAPAVPLTYHARVERIIQNNCVECHRKGAVGPFPLDAYADVVAHKAMIRKTVDKGTMPPWFAAPPKAGEHSPFVNDRTLTAADKKDLLAWLASDLKTGDPADAPLPRSYATGWGLGEPDAVFQVPRAIAVKAEGTMPYQIAAVPTEFAEDKWVRGLEVQPTAREVVHHVLVFALRPGRRADGDVQGFFAAYVPGSTALLYPEGYAKRLPKGAKLVFQIHYTPNGTATADRPRIGLVFAKEKPRYEVRVTEAANERFRIPPGKADHEITAAAPLFPYDVQILALFPHAHLRGKAMKYELNGPDGKTTALLEVPHYDFNWQLQYRFAKPVAGPFDGRIRYTAWYDNSDQNPANPDPKRVVKWGEQTTDEMHLGYVEYAVELNGESVVGPGGEFRYPKGGVRIPALYRKEFRHYDTNGDGVLDEKEYDAMPPGRKPSVEWYVKRAFP
jgi:thiol-disulfide isomerase/thioredoxin